MAAGAAGTRTLRSEAWECVVLHLDMDAFFASVEVLDDPSLAGRPVIVGGASDRGAVASCSYEARAFGVRSAMASAEARRRCPDAVFVSPRLDRYAEVSAALHRILAAVTPEVEPVGLDEAYLDVTGARRRLGAPPRIAAALQARVVEELGLSCAVGVARTKLLAKLASRRVKRVPPGTRGAGDAVLVVLPADERRFAGPVPLAEVPGIGPATAQRLSRVGLRTVDDLAGLDLAALSRLAGPAAAQLALLAGTGVPGPGLVRRPSRSIGRETTLAVDVRQLDALMSVLAGLAADVGARLGQQGLAARTVVVKVRFSDRRTTTRSVTVAGPVAGPHELLDCARPLLDRIAVADGVRLLGLSATGLVPAAAAAEQLSLTGLETTADVGAVVGSADHRVDVAGGPVRSARAGDAQALVQRWRRLDAAVVAVQQRYGPRAVVAAVGADRPSRAVHSPRQTAPRGASGPRRQQVAPRPEPER